MEGADGDLLGHGRDVADRVLAALGLDLPRGEGGDLVDEVVGVDHRALPGLHLAGGQVDHAVGEVVEVRGPVEAEALQDLEEDLEVVLLLVADHVDQAVVGPVLVAVDGGLRHIHDLHKTPNLLIGDLDSATDAEINGVIADGIEVRQFPVG